MRIPKRLRVFCVFFSLLLGACASVPEKAAPPDEAPPVEEALPDAGWPMLSPAFTPEEVRLSEPVPEAEADISWERRAAPSEDFALISAAAPDPVDEGPMARTGEEPPPAGNPEPAGRTEPAVSGPKPAPAPEAGAPRAPAEPPPAAGNIPAEQSGGPAASAVNPADTEDYFPPPERTAVITTGLPRRISGITGQTITVTLPGINWIYIPDEAAAGKIRYLGKVVEDGNTIFSFSPFEKGSYDLKFQQQDLAANTLRYDDVELSVDSAPESKTGEQPPAAGTQNAQAQPAPSESPPAAQIPGTQDPPPPESAAAPPADANETEGGRLKRLAQNGQAGAAAELENYVAGHEAELEDLDEWYFALAQIFENAPARDMKKALMYYEKVRDRFPLSSRWAASDTKSRYIRLNYFDIR